MNIVIILSQNNIYFDESINYFSVIFFICWFRVISSIMLIIHKELIRIYKLLIQMCLESFFHIIIGIFRLILKSMNCLPIKKESYLRSAILNCSFTNHFKIDLCRMTICGPQDIINHNEPHICNIFI